MLPVDQGNQPLSGYLLRIITALVAKGGGEIRIPALDMMESMEGRGILKHYDPSTKELVLRLAPSGSEALFVKEGDAWQGSARGQQSQQDQLSASRLRQPELMLTDQLLSPTQRQPQVVLDDERLYQLEQAKEMARLKREAEQIVTEFPAAPKVQRSQMRQSSPLPARAQRERFYKP